MSDKTKIIKKDISKFIKVPNVADYEAVYKNFTWDKAEKEEIEFFSDGTLNIAYNCIDRHAKGARKDKAALLFEGAKGEKEKYTFSDLKTLTDKFANVLVGQDVSKGDRVFIFLPSIPERYIVFLGILKMGAVAGTMFSAFQEMALLDRLIDSGAKVLITNPDLYPRIEKIWKDLPDLEKVIIVERGSNEFKFTEKIISYKEQMEKASEDFEIAHMEKDDYSYMLYTSGTTGKPKGVMHAHFDILQAIVTTKYVLDVQEDDIYWCTADIGWVTGVVYATLGPWGLGATQVMFEGRFSPESWYKVMQDSKVTLWYTAPTAIRMLMGSPVSPNNYDLASLRQIYSVGEPLNPEAIWWGLKALGLPFHDTWWQTELGGISITNYPVMDIRPGSMGKPLPGIKAAIIDDEGVELEDHKEGNLALLSSTVSSLMKTIWNNEEKFKSYFIGDWYISGDKAFRDKDGYYWFIGRADDVIKTSGERVGPFEVESSLVEHPSVIEAGVIGKPDAVRGEIIKAFVVTKPGVAQTDELKEELKQHVKKHLAGHAYPREIDFIDKLPKTRSGKIMRRVLKAKELGLPVGDTSTLEDY
ncbi:MAG TPA: acetate--CoA ligase [Candidatus Saccharimonadales bacterium]|nr:acetate--CoA ligase [Candidatus Saccharimonadales bacterium]